MTTTWILITWLYAIDGLPTLPITITPYKTFAECMKERTKVASARDDRGAVCRPVETPT